jgi:hypothetical protein
VRDGDNLETYRAIFGDESNDYEAALRRYYAEGAPASWQQSFVSAYATAHPSEDFAETFAHYLHIIDTLETAHAFGICITPEISDDEVLHVKVDFDRHHACSIDKLIDAWLPLTFAVNSVNRSMGQPDLYPFVLLPDVIDKLGSIHNLVQLAVAQTRSKTSSH